MIRYWHPQNGSLSTLAGALTVVEGALTANRHIWLVTCDGYRQLNLGGLLTQFAARAVSVGPAFDSLGPVAEGLAVAGNPVIIVAPRSALVPVDPHLPILQIGVHGLRRVLPLWTVDGQQQAVVTAAQSFAPGDVHQTSAVVRWAVGRLLSPEAGSLLVEVSVKPHEIVWSTELPFEPDRLLTFGTGATVVLAAGTTIGPARRAVAAAKEDLVATKLIPIIAQQPNDVDRRALRRLARLGRGVVLLLPGHGDFRWLEKMLIDAEIKYHLAGRGSRQRTPEEQAGVYQRAIMKVAKRR